VSIGFLPKGSDLLEAEQPTQLRDVELLTILA